MNLKSKIGLWIMHKKFLGYAAMNLNRIFFHWDKRQQFKSFGKLNPDKKFFVLRSDGLHDGLLAMYITRLRMIEKLINSGYIPIVDFENYPTQYTMSEPINGTRNVWEYYFEQPCEFKLSEVYNSKNVYLSGWKLSDDPTKIPDINYNDGYSYEIFKHAPIKKYILDMAGELIKNNNINEMAGVFLRGTDYTHLKPAGHAIQPAQETVADKLDEFINKFEINKIFLATEDEKIYNYFVKRYGEKIFTTDDDRNLIKNYSGQNFLTSEINSFNKYKFGLDYLVKMICLSKCKCLIASKAAGSFFASLYNGGKYSDKYIFDLGVY